MTKLALRFRPVWFLFFQLFPLVSALSINASKDIELRFLPLIGGPSFLPVHCRVVLYQDYGFDFVPVNPTSKETLQKLLSLQAVPGDARILAPKQQNDVEETSFSLPMEVSRAREFCTNYDKDLHLIQNNCWLFAYEMIEYIQKEDKDESR